MGSQSSLPDMKRKFSLFGQFLSPQDRTHLIQWKDNSEIYIIYDTFLYIKRNRDFVSLNSQFDKNFSSLRIICANVQV